MPRKAPKSPINKKICENSLKSMDPSSFFFWQWLPWASTTIKTMVFPQFQWLKPFMVSNGGQKLTPIVLVVVGIPGTIFFQIHPIGKTHRVCISAPLGVAMVELWTLFSLGWFEDDHPWRGAEMFVWLVHTGGRGGTFFRNLGNPLGEKFESCGGKLWILMIFRNASIGNTNSKDIRFSPHFSKQEGFFDQTFGCFFFGLLIIVKKKNTHTNSAQICSSRKWLWSGTPPRMLLGTRLVVKCHPPKTAADWLEKIGPAKRKIHHFKNQFSGETSLSHYLRPVLAPSKRWENSPNFWLPSTVSWICYCL